MGAAAEPGLTLRPGWMGRPQARAQLVTSALVKRAQAIEAKITM